MQATPKTHYSFSTKQQNPQNLYYKRKLLKVNERLTKLCFEMHVYLVAILGGLQVERKAEAEKNKTLTHFPSTNTHTQTSLINPTLTLTSHKIKNPEKPRNRFPKSLIFN